MPFQTGSIAIHDDGQHTGSAKRATVGGVAAISSAGRLVNSLGGAQYNGYVRSFTRANGVARNTSLAAAWTSRTSASAQLWRSVCWSPELGIFVAVAQTGAVGVQVMTSPDGITWTSRTAASEQQWTSVVWSPELGILVAVAYDGAVGVQVMTSPDGITWTSRTSASAQQWASVVWSPELGILVAVARNGVVGVQVMTNSCGRVF